MLPKQGKEETEQFFARMSPEELVDISSINNQFKTTSWLFGFAPQHTSVAVAPSGAGMLRLQAMGESHIVLVPMSQLALAVKLVDGEEVKLTAAGPIVSGLTEDKLDAYKKVGMTAYSTTLKANQLLWIPTGWIIAERVGSMQLHYGVRKSYFANTPEARKELTRLISADKNDGKSAARLAQVLALYKQ